MNIRGADRGRTLVAVHTWRHEDVAYRQLAAALGRPILDQLPPSGPVLPAGTGDWVDHHARLLAEQGIEGDIDLIGWSFGGVVALELARRLSAGGREVGAVVMIDSIRPRQRPRGASASFWYHMGEAAQLPPGPARWRYLGRWGLRIGRNRLFRVQWAARAVGKRIGLVSSTAPTRGPADLLQRAVQRSYLRYDGTTFDHPVALLTTDESRERSWGDPSLGWSRWLRGGFEVYPVPGTHRGLFEEATITTTTVAIADALRVADPQ